MDSGPKQVCFASVATYSGPQFIHCLFSIQRPTGIRCVWLHRARIHPPAKSIPVIFTLMAVSCGNRYRNDQSTEFPRALISSACLYPGNNASIITFEQHEWSGSHGGGGHGLCAGVEDADDYFGASCPYNIYCNIYIHIHIHAHIYCAFVYLLGLLYWSPQAHAFLSKNSQS